MACELKVGSDSGSAKISEWSTTVRRGWLSLSQAGRCWSVTR